MKFAPEYLFDSETGRSIVTQAGLRARIIADSVTTHTNGIRLTTIELRYPRFIHAEIMTHRDRARNSASSRAIPWTVMMENVESDPVIPIEFGAEKRGMQTGGSIPDSDAEEAKSHWLRARNDALYHAGKLAELGVHKSICNRIVEPWMWITVVMTATNWANLWRLRDHPDAEVHFQLLAKLAKEAMRISVPVPTEFGTWHLPYVETHEVLNDPNEPKIDWRKVSVARCARVSYLTHDKKRDPQADLNLFEKLCQGSGFGHWSPHEHVATPATPDVRSGPFRGWIQYRKFFENEVAAD